MNAISPYQERYWKEFYQMKVHVNYLEIYLEKSEFFNKSISIFLAFTSSSSICSWAIWNDYGFIWGIIIALSQLINVIKHFLPYQDRLKSLPKIIRDLEGLLIICEEKWFDVSEGRMTEEEINKLQFEIKKKKKDSLHKHLGGNSLPNKDRYSDKAKKMANTYITNFYTPEV